MTDHARHIRARWLRRQQHPISATLLAAVATTGTLLACAAHRALAIGMLAYLRGDLRFSERLVATYRADSAIELAKQVHIREQIARWERSLQ
jgi:hypothetical protein